MGFDLNSMLGGNAPRAGQSIVAQLATASSSTKTMDIPISDIFPDAENSQVYSIEDIEELAASIQVSGLLHNIVVTPKDGKYMLISGERRWTAHRYLVEQGHTEFSTIRAMVSTDENDNLRKLKWIMANASARKLTDAEQAKQALLVWEILEGLKADGSITGNVRSQVSKMLDISKTQLARYRKIDNNLIPELRDEFDADRMPISTAAEAASLAPEKQQALAARIKEGERISLSEVTEMNKPEAPAPQPEPQPQPQPEPQPQPQPQPQPEPAAQEAEENKEIKKAAIESVIADLEQLIEESTSIEKCLYIDKLMDMAKKDLSEF